MTLSIGPVALPNPVILAPMSGVTDMPFRRQVKSFGCGLVISEMIASQAMIRASEKSRRIADTTEDEKPIAIQLAGNEPEIMAEAARMNQDLGAAIIDINMGCPVKKVVKGYAGSALMRDERLAGRIIEAVVKAVTLPVTVKMRLGWDHSCLNAPSLAQIAENSGAVAVTVHGRTRQQFFKDKADWRAIAAVKDAISIPLIGNGDIHTPEDAKTMLEHSGADGVMVGRATYGRPWLPAAIAHFIETGQHLSEPGLQKQMEVVLEHYETMLEHYGFRAGARVARKHLSWYSRGLPGSAQFRQLINSLDNAERVREEIHRFYDPLISRAAA